MNQSGPDQEAFTEIGTTSAKASPSRFTVIRQTILGVLLVIALTGLAWEYLVVRPSFERATTYLDELQERFIRADSISAQGDENGEGINPEFLRTTIREFIGFEPQEVRRYEGTNAVVEIYHWRRANLYQTLSLAIQFREKGVDKNMIFAEWYSDLEMIPDNPGRAILVSVEEAGPLMSPAGMGGPRIPATQPAAPATPMEESSDEAAVEAANESSPAETPTERPRSGSLVKDLWSLWSSDEETKTESSENAESSENPEAPASEDSAGESEAPAEETSESPESPSEDSGETPPASDTPSEPSGAADPVSPPDGNGGGN